MCCYIIIYILRFSYILLSFLLIIRRPPRSTRTNTLFPSRRSSDLLRHVYPITNREFTGIVAPKQKLHSSFALMTDKALRKRAGQNNIAIAVWRRSEEHTSELQSLMRISYAVFCLKKKKDIRIKQHY